MAPNKRAVAEGDLDYEVVGRHLPDCPKKYRFGRKTFTTEHGVDYMRVICATKNCKAHLKIRCNDLLTFLLG